MVQVRIPYVGRWYGSWRPSLALSRVVSVNAHNGTQTLRALAYARSVRSHSRDHGCGVCHTLPQGSCLIDRNIRTLYKFRICIFSTSTRIACAPHPPPQSTCSPSFRSLSNTHPAAFLYSFPSKAEETRTGQLTVLSTDVVRPPIPWLREGTPIQSWTGEEQQSCGSHSSVWASLRDYNNQGGSRTLATAQTLSQRILGGTVPRRFPTCSNSICSLFMAVVLF